ncbi:MAG: MBL fold metallo-hydrolase [Pirellulaceae bacterium]|nr:MBL fold metallo-hydrolase [Pirellulaceae bacterium]
MQITHHGGHLGVTGSCHQLHLNDKRSLLIDCGLFQGADARGHEDMDIDFPLDGIQSLIVTHVHIDHIGRIPYLLEAGFRGPIYCSRPTAYLMPIMLQDAIQLSITRNKRAIKEILSDLKQLLRPLPYGRWEKLDGGVEIRMNPAGHVLGSAVVEVDFNKERFVFSGDIGSRCTPLLNEPTSPERADMLVLESTYGNRLHEGREDRVQRLESILCHTMENRGVTIIPAFSLGRTQELLFEINLILEGIEVKRTCSLIDNIDVIVDSPMALKLTDIYNDMQEYWGDEAQRIITIDSQPLIFKNLVEIDYSGEHKGLVEHLLRSRKPAIVIAGSGMCSGGRVMNYLKAFLDKETTDILFVGYQAYGTLGRRIQDAKPGEKVKIDGLEFAVCARVHTISGYSAHADQSDLLRFVQGMGQKPTEIRLVHGEDSARAVLREKLEELDYKVS